MLLEQELVLAGLLPSARSHEKATQFSVELLLGFAMVHRNNGASELGTWAGVFTEFAKAIGAKADANAAFGALFDAALDGEADGGGLLAYNYLAGEPITGLAEGRPLIVRTPGSRLNLANFMRTQLYATFGTLSLGMNVLHGEGVKLDSMFAHGGMFKTAGVAQRLLAAAIGAPATVGDTASEGGAWGIAVLAEYRMPSSLHPHERSRTAGQRHW